MLFRLISVYLPVPLPACQPSFHSGIHSQIGGRECTLRVNGLLLTIEDSAQSQTYQMPNPGEGDKGSSSVLTYMCFLPSSMRLDSRCTI